MLEFLFGWIVGVWMGQQLPLPSVQTAIHNWWFQQISVTDNSTPEADNISSEDESVPLFTGDMPPQPPAV